MPRFRMANQPERIIIMTRQPLDERIECKLGCTDLHGHGDWIVADGFTCRSLQYRDEGCGVLHATVREAVFCLLEHTLATGTDEFGEREITRAELSGESMLDVRLSWSSRDPIDDIRHAVRVHFSFYQAAGLLLPDGSIDVEEAVARFRAEFAMRGLPPLKFEVYEKWGRCPMFESVLLEWEASLGEAASQVATALPNAPRVPSAPVQSRRRAPAVQQTVKSAARAA
jgi:hypothetical protein